MKIYCSLLRYQFEGSTLLDYNQDTPQLPRVGGGKQVEVVPLVQAEQVGVYDRGNTGHTVTVVRAVEGSPNTIHQLVANHAKTIPSGQGPLTITAQGGGSATLNDAIVSDWDAYATETHAVLSWTLTGGSFT